MRSIRDRVVAITGAGSGIGRAVALEFARHGARLALSDWKEDSLAETRSCVEREVGRSVAHTRVVNVAERDQVFAWARDIARDLTPAHVLVNNAGVSLVSSALDSSPEDFAWLLDINLWGTVHGCQAFTPAMITLGEGHIVNVSSVFGLMGAPNQAAYNMAKFAVRGYSDSLLMELRRRRLDIGVTCVHPGGIRTNIARNARTRGGDHAQIVADFERLARNGADYCAKKILRAVRKNRARAVIGADAIVLDLLARLFPGHYQRMVCAFLGAEEKAAAQR